MRSEARPFRQSDIDGLCGLHALFNAVHYLFPKKFPLWGESAYELAHAIADDMSDAEFKAAWKHGQERSDMERMLVAASDHLRKEGHALAWTAPFDMEPPKRIDAFWNRLKEAVGSDLGRSALAIVGFEEPDPHWSCVIGIAPSTVRLFDSSIYKRIRRSDTTLGASAPSERWVIKPDDALIVRRVA
jgi:hypothetical protein